MRALGEPDAFPSADLGLLHALALANPREPEQRTEAWRPWRAYAAMYLWNIPSDSAVGEIKSLPAQSKSVEAQGRPISLTAGRGSVLQQRRPAEHSTGQERNI